MRRLNPTLPIVLIYTGNAVAIVLVSAVVQYPQNRNSGGLSFPQLGHLVTAESLRPAL